MDIEDARPGPKIPVALHFIALFYIVQAIYIFYIFSTTRKYASLTLITVDIITLLLLLIPLVAIWSIYKPNRYLRWFPLYGILFNLVVIFGIGNFMLNIDWLTEVSEKSTSDAENFVSGMMTIFFSFVLTLWMVLPAIPLYSNESTRRYVLLFYNSVPILLAKRLPSPPSLLSTRNWWLSPPSSFWRRLYF